MARKEELARMWERTLDYLFNQRPAFEREGGKGYKPGLDTALALDKLYKERFGLYFSVPFGYSVSEQWGRKDTIREIEIALETNKPFKPGYPRFDSLFGTLTLSEECVI